VSEAETARVERTSQKVANPNNVIIEVEGTSAEYWDGPGSNVEVDL
jgi:hypothetical protein